MSILKRIIFPSFGIAVLTMCVLGTALISCGKVQSGEFGPELLRGFPFKYLGVQLQSYIGFEREYGYTCGPVSPWENPHWVNSSQFLASFIIIYFFLQTLLELGGYKFGSESSILQTRKKIDKVGLFVTLFFLIAPGCMLSLVSGEPYFIFIVPMIIFESVKEVYVSVLSVL